MQNDFDIAGKEFGDFLIERILGETHYAQCLLATRKDSPDGPRFRIRRFQTQLSENQNFNRYFQFLMKVVGLIRHDMIPPVTTSGNVEGRLFYAQEFIQGMSVSEMTDHSLRGAVHLSPDVAIAIVHQLIECLSYTASVKITDARMGIFHSNISPGNVFLCGDGLVRLLDFRPPFNRPDILAGLKLISTTRFSPEMVFKTPVGEETEVFLLGLLLYEMIYQEPFLVNVDSGDKLMSELRRKLPLKKDIPEDAPPMINKVIAGLLIAEPDTRRIKSLAAMKVFFAEHLGVYSRQETRTILGNYYRDLASDTLGDVLAGFKEEIGGTLDGLSHEDVKRPGLMTATNEAEPVRGPVSTSQSSTIELSSVATLNRTGIRDFVNVLRKLKPVLRIRPSQELTKSAYLMMQNIRQLHQVHEYFSRANHALKSGDAAEAITCYLSILSLEKDNDKALAGLKSVVAGTETARDPATQEGEAHLVRGMSLCTVKKYHEAIAELKHIERSSLYFRLGKELIEKASSQIDQQVETEFAFQKGISHIDDDQLEQAIEQFTKILVVDPLHGDSLEHFAKAVSRLMAQQHEIETNLAEATAAIQGNDPRKALEIWRHVLTIDTRNENIRASIAQVEADLEKRNVAIQAHLQKADAFIEVERIDKALAEWSAVLALDPSRDDIRASIEKARKSIEKESRGDDTQLIVSVEEESLSPAVSEAGLEEITTEDTPGLPPESEEEILEELSPIDELSPVEQADAGHAAAEQSTVENQSDETFASTTGDGDRESIDLKVRRYLNEGLHYYGIRDFKKAIVLWQHVLEIDPAHEQAREYIDLVSDELGVDESATSSLAEPAQIPEEIIDERPHPGEEIGLVVDTGHHVDSATLPEYPTAKINIEVLEHDSDDLPELELELENAHSDISRADMPEDEAVFDSDRQDLMLDGEYETPSMDAVPEGPDSLSLDTPPPGSVPQDLLQTEEAQADSTIAEYSLEQLDKLHDEDEKDQEEVHVPPKTREVVRSEFPPASSVKSSVSEFKKTESIDDMFTRGLQSYEAGAFEDAISTWSALIKLQPNHTKTHILLQKAKEKLAQHLQQLEHEQTVTRQRKRKLMVFSLSGAILILVLSIGGYFGWQLYAKSHRYNQAMTLFDAGKYAESLPHFEVYLTFQENDLDALEKLGRAYMSIDRPRQALETFERLRTLSGERPGLLVLQGQASVQNGDYTAAHDFFQSALAADPENTDARLGSARSLLRLGRMEETIQQFETLRQQNPDSIRDDDWVLLGQAYMHMRDFAKAVDSFARVRVPSFEPVYGTARSYFEMEDYSQAVPAFLRAKALDEKSVDNRLYLGRTYYRMKEYQKAIDEYLSIIEMFPEDLSVYLELGTAYLKLDRQDDAIAYYQRALTYHPDSAKLHFSLGVAYHKRGDLDVAVEKYHLALAAQPDYADALTNLGSVYLEKKDKENALKAFQASLKINPDQPLLQKTLLRLGIR